MQIIYSISGDEIFVDDDDYPLLNRHRWSVTREGYVIGQIADRSITMHLLIMGKRKGHEVDHINGVGCDNRKCNLRFCTHSENMRNSISQIFFFWRRTPKKPSRARSLPPIHYGPQKIVPFRCKQCGHLFQGKPNSRYCSAACKQKHYRFRKRIQHNIVDISP